MDRFPLIIDRKDSVLSTRNGQIRIDTPSQTHSVPVSLVEMLIIAVNARLTTATLQKLAEEGIITLILPARGKGEPAWVTPGLSASWQIRQCQYRHINHPAIAWRIVEKKLHAQHNTLKLLNCPLGVLKDIHIPATPTIDKIMGIEGAAARHYFQQLAEVVPENWRFEGRTRRPPRDPFNALLSLTYTLFTTEALKAAQAHGFDPWVGFLHHPYPGRPAIALDLIEPWRAQIDLWCLAMTEMLDPEEHFESTQQGILLNKQGRDIYFSSWGQDRQNWYNDKSVPQLLREETLQLKEWLEETESAH